RFGSPRYLGGEYSKNAVQLAAEMFDPNLGIFVRQFDFYEADFDWVAQQPGPLVVFTCYALQQVPRCAPILERMAKSWRGLPITVVHFEPVGGLRQDSLLGMLRHRYSLVNDYNSDLWDAVHGIPYCHVQQTRRDVFGLNPLDPVSIIKWVPKS